MSETVALDLSTLRVIVQSSLKSSAPGLSETMRGAIATQIGLKAMVRSLDAWKPIKDLPEYVDTQIVLWNPCDGVHLPNVALPKSSLDNIRNGNVFTHWQHLAPPKEAAKEEMERRIF